jgi:hypothetical protein
VKDDPVAREYVLAGGETDFVGSVVKLRRVASPRRPRQHRYTWLAFALAALGLLRESLIIALGAFGGIFVSANRFARLSVTVIGQCLGPRNAAGARRAK